MPTTHKKQPSKTAAVLGMGACYALGTFTDNFYKQAAILLAAATQMGSMQSIATLLFSLPFILFSAWAGWLADRLPKKYIVVAAKSLELLALLVGGIMLVQGAWPGIIAVICVMGTQAAVFSPAINGSIPENFPAPQVPRVNSLIKLASTAAILAGMALAGVFLDMRPQSLGGALPDALLSPTVLQCLGAAPGDGDAYGRAAAAVFVAAIALLGLLTSFVLRTIPAAGDGRKNPFPWTGPLDSLRYSLNCRKDRELFTVLVCEAYFYGVAAIAVISIANMAKAMGYSNTTAGIMTAVLMVGIALGSLIAGRQRAESWRKMTVPAACGMSLMLVLTGLSPLFASGPGFDARLWWIFGILFCCGTFGGLYLIPLSSFIQIRPAPAEKGKILAVSNFLGFTAMGISGAAFQLISLLPPHGTFMVYAACTLGVALFFAAPRIRALPGGSMREASASLLGLFLKMLLALRYKVTETGLDTIPRNRPAQTPLDEERNEAGKEGVSPGTGILFLPNHPALVDPLVVYSRIAGLSPRPLSDEGQMRGPLQAFAARVIRAVTIPDLEKEGRKGREAVQQGLLRIIEALRNGDNILLYPSGRVFRAARESVGGNSAVYQILSQLPEVRVVLVRTTGLWGSSFSYAGGNRPKFTSCLLRGVRTLLANALFFTPKREVTVEFVETGLKADQGRKRLNARLDEFYNQATRPAMLVPRFFWQGREAVPLTEAPEAGGSMEPCDVSPEVRERVYDLIREQTDGGPDTPIAPGMRLRTDLALDSLALMDLAAALEKEFGCALPNLEGLDTVGDCLAAASGQFAAEAEKSVAIPGSWFSAAPEGATSSLTIPEARTAPEAFLHMARLDPGRPLAADRSGTHTRRQILTGVLPLTRQFAAIPGRRLGIMLPSAPAALVVWLATLLAGKEPVFLNWTLGPRNIRHCIQSSGIHHCVTATALLDQLERTDIQTNAFDVAFIRVDALASKLSPLEKLRAAASAFLHCSPLPWHVSARKVPDTAAILFTSGSEAAPKAVPLSHANIMTNAADLAATLKVRQDDRLLAMLPPFHSFGLLLGLTMPAVSGIAAAYHPNPTESARLVSLVRDFKLTLMGATPTFLEAVLSRAAEQKGEYGRKAEQPNGQPPDMQKNPLASLRFVFAGAEKCPEHVYRAFARVCPQAALCEGYGITECSPVVSVNVPGNAVAGSIGHPLPSVRTAVVREQEGGPDGAYTALPASPGETGMLLVRGPSVFSGYLRDEDGQTPPDPFVTHASERWYRTGDLVVQEADGRLFFKGRLKRFVKIGGEMLSLPLMETLLQEAFSGREDLPEDGKAFVAVEVRPGSEEAGQAEILCFTVLPLTLQEVNSVFRQAGMAPVFAVKRIVGVREIPLLGSGKTDYRSLRALV